MSIYIDADAFVLWEKGEFDLPGWLAAHKSASFAFPAAVWQQLSYGVFGRQADRAQKRARFLSIVADVAIVISFTQRHAEQAASIEAELKREKIGFADCQIAASALVDGAELLTFNTSHFSRVPGLKLATH
jgi:predicted nucleic acid-binding protein